MFSSFNRIRAESYEHRYKILLDDGNREIQLNSYPISALYKSPATSISKSMLEQSPIVTIKRFESDMHPNMFLPHYKNGYTEIDSGGSKLFNITTSIYSNTSKSITYVGKINKLKYITKTSKISYRIKTISMNYISITLKKLNCDETKRISPKTLLPVMFFNNSNINICTDKLVALNLTSFPITISDTQQLASLMFNRISPGEPALSIVLVMYRLYPKNLVIKTIHSQFFLLDGW